MQEWNLRDGMCLQDINDKRVTTCLQRYDTDACTRLQFPQAVSHSILSYTDDMCGVADNSSSGDDKESDVDEQQSPNRSTRHRRRRPRTPTCPLPSTTARCVSWRPRIRVALVPWGHSRFCGPCADEVHCCPVCRSTMLLRLYWLCLYGYSWFHLLRAVTIILDMCLQDDVWYQLESWFISNYYCKNTK